MTKRERSPDEHSPTRLDCEAHSWVPVHAHPDRKRQLEERALLLKIQESNRGVDKLKLRGWCLYKKKVHRLGFVFMCVSAGLGMGCDSGQSAEPKESTAGQESPEKVHTIASLMKKCGLDKGCPEVPECEGERIAIAGHLQWINTFNPKESRRSQEKFFFYGVAGKAASVGDVLGNTQRFLEVRSSLEKATTFYNELWKQRRGAEEFSARAKIRARVRGWKAHGMKCPTRISLELESPKDFEWMK